VTVIDTDGEALVHLAYPCDPRARMAKYMAPEYFDPTTTITSVDILAKADV
jgi:hypothetical protein